MPVQSGSRCLPPHQSRAHWKLPRVLQILYNCNISQKDHGCFSCASRLPPVMERLPLTVSVSLRFKGLSTLLPTIAASSAIVSCDNDPFETYLWPRQKKPGALGFHSGCMCPDEIKPRHQPRKRAGNSLPSLANDSFGRREVRAIRLSGSPRNGTTRKGV